MHTFKCDLLLLNAAAVNAAADNAAAVNAADVNTAANTGSAPRPRPVRAPTLTLTLLRARCLSPQRCELLQWSMGHQMMMDWLRCEQQRGQSITVTLTAYPSERPTVRRAMLSPSPYASPSLSPTHTLMPQ